MAAELGHLGDQVAQLLAAVLEAPLGHDGEAVADEAARELGLADLALGEGDRHLADVEAGLDGQPSEVDLEDVAGRGELVEVKLLEDLAAEGAVAGGGVRQAGAQRQRDVHVAAAGEDPALLGPVDHLAALDVAGADDEVGALGDLLEEQVQLLRGVRAVGVHLAEDLVVALQAPLEAGEVGAEQAALALPVQDVDVVVGRGQLVGLLAGAVGAVVVDDEHVHLGLGGAQPRGDEGQVAQLVVGRDDDQGAVTWCHDVGFSF